jgi:TatD DNase family protein
LEPRAPLIDTHCHLNDPSFDDRLTKVIGRARAAGVGAFVVPCYDRDSLERTISLAERLPDVVFPAFGIHPWYLEEDFQWTALDPYLRRKDTVAVGEIGLDFSPGMPPQEVQVGALRIQLRMARDRGLPVILHCRKAHEAMLKALRDFKPGLRGVMHSFSGSVEVMRSLLEMGYFISFSGSVTRSRAKKYHRTAREVPVERLLVETDAPSIATETTVASEVEPCHVVEVVQVIAALRGISFEAVAWASSENARRLFGLPGE